MSVSANKLVKDFERKLNAVNSGRMKNYRIVDIVCYLNEAQEIWFENKVFEADTNYKVRNDLRAFLVPKKEFECVEVDCDCCKIIFPDNYYKKLSVEVKVCNEKCCPGIGKTFGGNNLKEVQYDDKHNANNDLSWEPDFKWEQLTYNVGPDGLYFYTNGEMDISSVCMDYYRKPEPIEAPELVDCGNLYVNVDDRIITQNKDFEVCATYANRQITDIAVYLAARDSGNPNQTNSQLQKILQIDKLYRT